MTASAKPKILSKRLESAAKYDPKRVHVTYHGNSWALRKEGNILPTRLLRTQNAALSIASDLVRTGKASQVVLHSKDGRVL